MEKTEETNKQQDTRLDRLNALTQNVETRMDGIKNDVTASIMEEMREREEKKLNIILHNVGEATRSSWEEEKNWDVQSFNNIMQAISADISFESSAVFSRRLGSQAEGRCRPLLVGLNDENMKNTILKQAKRLAGTPFGKVSIAPDLTQRQREADEGLREEAASRNNSLTQQDRAKNLKWVVVGRKGMRKLVKKADNTAQTRGHQPGPNRKRPRDGTAAGGTDPASQRPRISVNMEPGTSGTASGPHVEEVDPPQDHAISDSETE